MWTISPPLKLLRYLIVLRVNSTLVRLAPSPTADFSRTLGEIIASRLPTPDARVWNKALKVWQGYVVDENGEMAEPAADRRSLPAQNSDFPNAAWPIDAILRLYPGKQIYGQGEQILCEIKLLGESADHNLFLEILLPALEAASLSSDGRWTQNNALWGRFEIESVFVAEGLRWQPVVQQGQIDLKLRPTYTQWAYNLPFKVAENRQLRTVIWQTPFAFADQAEATSRKPANTKKSENPSFPAPSLSNLLNACAQRIDFYLPGWLESKQRPVWKDVLDITARAGLVSSHLEVPSRQGPGRAIGKQSFSKIPPVSIPYLVLGSLLHVGQYTHLGCGTFLLDR